MMTWVYLEQHRPALLQCSLQLHLPVRIHPGISYSSTEMSAPSVAAGILRAGDLAAYRSHQVYIGGSKQVPLNMDAVRDVEVLRCRIC